MSKDQKKIVKKREIDLEIITKLITAMEENLDTLKKTLFDVSYQRKISSQVSLDGQEKNSQVVEGIFNGEEMVDSQGKKYSVPANYASKSKLVPGDILKLTILSDGSFVFKQIGPVERQKIVGELGQKGGRFQVKAGNKSYNVLQASVTYFKAKVGDKTTIIIPKNQQSNWAVIENIIH